MKQDLRHLLRQETRNAHDRLDQLISTLDITQIAGFGIFLRLHLCCFLAMQSRISARSKCSATLAQMIIGLRKDLDAVGCAQGAPNVGSLPMVDALAVDYMVAGSRLGSQVLQKTWSRTDNTVVQRADNYFGISSDPTLWRATCQALSDISVDGPRAAIIIKDTGILFQLFETAFEALVADQDAFV